MSPLLAGLIGALCAGLIGIWVISVFDGFSVEQVNAACARDHGVTQVVSTQGDPASHWNKAIVVCRDGRVMEIK